MSEEEIQTFITITATSRRCAIWFIAHNSDLNEAVESYYENGESSIPEDFVPEGEDSFSDFVHEEEEDDDESEILIEQDPQKETAEPTISPIQLNLIEDTETIIESPQQIIKKNIAEGSKLTYILKNYNEQNKKKNLNSDDLYNKSKNSKFKQRNNAAKTIPFVIWKNGYSAGNVFTQKSENEMKELFHQISIGKVPSDIPDVNDIQLVDRSSQLYDPSFDPSSVLVF